MIGLHALSVFTAFVAGGLVTLYFDSTTTEDMNVFGWSAVGACMVSLITFTAAVSL